jgi:hypothetical protein
LFSCTYPSFGPTTLQLISLYFHSKLFGPLAFESHLPSQPKTPVFFNLRQKKTATLLHLTKPAPLPLLPPGKASGCLRNMELNRLDVLSFSPHSIEDFPFVSPPKTCELWQLQPTSPLAQFH